MDRHHRAASIAATNPDPEGPRFTPGAFCCPDRKPALQLGRGRAARQLLRVPALDGVKSLEQRVSELEGQVGPFVSSVDPLSDQIDELESRVLDTEDCISKILRWSTGVNTRFYC